MPYDRRGAVSLWPAPSFFSDYPRLTQTLPTAPQLVNAESPTAPSSSLGSPPAHRFTSRLVDRCTRRSQLLHCDRCLGLDGFLGSRPWATDPAFQQHTNGEYRARPLLVVPPAWRPDLAVPARRGGPGGPGAGLALSLF